MATNTPSSGLSGGTGLVREFGDPKPEVGVEAEHRVGIGDVHLSMVDAGRGGTPVRREVEHHPRLWGHRGAQLDADAADVAEVQGRTLMGDFRPCRLHTPPQQPGVGGLKISFGGDAKAQPLHPRLVAALEHQTVVGGLLDSAEVDGVGVALGDDETDEVLVELDALGQVGHGQHDVTDPGDPEAWMCIAGGEFQRWAPVGG